MSYSIGYVGLGNMGSQMCNNLCKYASQNGLVKPKIFNRSPDKYQSIQGAEIAGSLEEMVQSCNVIFTCLLNDAVAEEVYDKLLSAVKKDREITFVDQSSLTPMIAVKLQKEAAARGAEYLSSPVFGPPAAAKSAQLLLVLAGDNEAKEKVKPLLVPAVGKKVLDVGTDASKGAIMKLLGNTCILGTIELLGEVYALADSIEFDPTVVQDFIGQWFPAAAWVNYGTKISKGTFAGGHGFKLNGGMKDARNILSLGADLGHPCPVPTIETALKHMARAEEIGGQGMDWSSLAVAVRENAGLNPFRDGSDGGKAHTNGTV